MAVRCPFCDRRIKMRGVDIERDTATCHGCGKSVKFSSLPGVADNPSLRRLMDRLGVGPPGVGAGAGQSVTGGGVTGPVQGVGPLAGQVRPPPQQAPATGLDVSRPPAGAWYRDDGVTLEIGASTRSVGLGVFLLLISAFWCSVTGVFVVVAISGILQGLGLGTGGGRLGSVGLGVGLFMLLFCTPFVGVGLWMLWSSILCVGGRDVVTIRDDTLERFSGVGSIGFRRQLRVSSVQRVEEDVKVSRTKHGTAITRTVAIYTDAPKPLKLGAMFSDERRRFVLEALRQVLTPAR